MWEYVTSHWCLGRGQYTRQLTNQLKGVIEQIGLWEIDFVVCYFDLGSINSSDLLQCSH